MILFSNKTTQSDYMNKTCNLPTVKNTPSEARRNTASVVYYYIDFHEDANTDTVARWHTIRGVIETIWELLEDTDLYCLDGRHICAYMSDGSVRHVRYMSVDINNRSMRISRVG